MKINDECISIVHEIVKQAMYFSTICIVIG